jgi:hypothetical protein
MVVEIQPAPPEDARAAILAALERLLDESRRRRIGSEWWQAGLREGLDEEESFERDLAPGLTPPHGP